MSTHLFKNMILIPQNGFMQDMTDKNQSSKPTAVQQGNLIQYMTMECNLVYKS